MIHSMAGGSIKDLTYSDYAKVEILEGTFEGKLLWFKSPFFNLKIGDIVLVETDLQVKGKVVKIDHNISNQIAPLSLRKTKNIIKIVEKNNG